MNELKGKDVALAQHFAKHKDSDPVCMKKLKLVMNRLKVVKKEIAEMKAEMGM